MVINKQNLPYYQELVILRGFLEREVKEFPWCKCDQTTRMTHLVTGLEEVSGRYVPSEDRHSWNYDSRRGLYIDLTQDQFPHRGRIVVMPADTPILREEDTPMKEYHSLSGDPSFRRKISDLLGAYLTSQNTQRHQK